MTMPEGTGPGPHWNPRFRPSSPPACQSSPPRPWPLEDSKPPTGPMAPAPGTRYQHEGTVNLPPEQMSYL
ncbi:MAG: hypothetical protein JEZ06_22335 [Anaerolineaceae bacterium]|nr:hypothetical protein [Anaerolineaceae bacterium]